MKKISIKFITHILIFMMLVSGVFSIPVYAISTSCIQDHFSRLYTTGTEESPTFRTPPSQNTCPYVAMSLLLTFYDSYWNDRFVDDHYEWEKGKYNSTNDKLEDTFAPKIEGMDWKDYTDTNYPNVEEDQLYQYYRDYAIANAGNFLEPYLISIGMSLGYHPATDETLGLSAIETIVVLSYYLYSIRNFTENEVVINYLHEDNGDVEGKIRERIASGFPVLYIGHRIVESTDNTKAQGSENSETVGHVLVAYGLNNVNDIMLHTGYDENHLQSYKYTNYKYDRAIIWLEINEENLPHVCSDAYVDSVTDETYCACEVYCGSHPNGTHAAGDGYLSYTNAGHNKPCKRCEKTVFVSHSYTHTPCNNNNYHLSTCACGYTTNTGHVVNIPSGNAKIGTCISCGASVTIGNGTIMPWGDNGGNSSTYAMNSSIQYITENGSYVLPEGIIIISDADYELYLSGELDINELIYDEVE